MGILAARRRASSPVDRCHSAVLWCGAAAFTIVASLAACGGRAPSVMLPSKQRNAPTAPSPFVARATSTKRAVIDAYLAFWPVSDQAEKAGNATVARAILAQYVDPNYMSFIISGMRAAWARREVNWGASVEHIQSVSVARLNSGVQTAVVRDCQDDSHDGLASAQTGALLPGTLGPAHQELYASLSLINGRWLIEQVTSVGDTCTS
jgi:predicted small lipoprotein YifL